MADANDPAAAAATSSALVPTPPALLNPASMGALQTVYGPSVVQKFITFDPKTRAGRILMDKCAEEPDFKAKLAVNMKFNLAHIYAHHVEFEAAEGGELKRGVRTCLISDDGKVYACTSDGIAQSVARLVEQEGQIPFPKPVPIILKMKKTKNDHDWLYFVNDPDAPEPKGGKK